MKSTVETLGPTRVRLAVEVPYAELEPSVRKAYQEVARQVTIPGFRKGKVPAAVIDQRIGRGTVLNEAVQEVLPQQLFAALREHEVRTLGRPEVGELEFDDGQPLKFTAEVDVRPEITLPDLAGVAVTVDAAEVTDEDVDQQVDNLRDRFATLKSVTRPAREGDYVQLDLEATVDGQSVEGGTASNISHEVGSGQLVPGLDEVLVGMAADDRTTFTTTLVGGEYADREADIAVTVRTVKEKEVPPLDDDFAQLASEFDTLAELRDDVRHRLAMMKQSGQLYQARDRALDELVERAGVPTPDGVVRDEVAHRKQHLTEELEQAGQSMADYLQRQELTEEDLERQLSETAARGVRVEMVLDALAEAEQVEVPDEEYARGVASRAQQAGVEPQQYYDQLVRSGMAGAVHAEVRRERALRLLLERVTITDTAGNRVGTEALQEEGG